MRLSRLWPALAGLALALAACGSSDADIQSASTTVDDAGSTTVPAPTSTEVVANGCQFDQVPEVGQARLEFDMETFVEGCVSDLEASQRECNDAGGGLGLQQCLSDVALDAALMLDQVMALAVQLPELYALDNPDNPLVDANAWATDLEAAATSFDSFVDTTCDLVLDRTQQLPASGRAQTGDCRIDLIQERLTFLATFWLVQ
jgi:hypothetical protein